MQVRAVARVAAKTAALHPGAEAMAADPGNTEAMHRALSDLYGALARMPDGAMVVDTDAQEQEFGVLLTPVANHIAAWPTG